MIYKNYEYDRLLPVRAVPGDAFDDLAERAYGDPMLAGLIRNENLSIADKYRLDGGEVVFLPVITRRKSSALPPWKEVGA